MLTTTLACGSSIHRANYIPASHCLTVSAVNIQELEDYSSMPDDLIGSSKRWQEWMELERPEDEPLPGDWKRMPEFERLLIFRTLRPDRLTAAMQRFVANTIGKEFTSSQQFDLERSFQVTIHVFFLPCWHGRSAQRKLPLLLSKKSDRGAREDAADELRFPCVFF